MSRLVNVTVVLLFSFTTGSVCTALAQQAQMTAAAAPVESERARDGLSGPVRRIKTEMAKLANKTGKSVEGQRQVLETVAYDIKGTKTENAYYPVSSANLTGKETYKYDEKGNISEMTLLNTDGTLLSKEVYTYEFDFFGNWTKMTTSVAVIENGKLSFEPTEVTYRAISYYLDEATMAKMAAQQAAPAPQQQQVVQSQPAPAQPASSTVSNNAVMKQEVAKLDQPQPKPAGSGNQLAATDPAKSNHASQPVAPAEDKPAPTQNVAQNQGAPQNSPSPASTAAASKPEPAKDDSSETVIPAPEAAGPKPLLRPVSGGVLNGSAVTLPKPTYPDQARNARAQGVVVVEVIIDVNGKVISARAISRHMLLQQAAVQAAYQAKFSPTTLSGRPVKVAGTINYNFALAK